MIVLDKLNNPTVFIPHKKGNFEITEKWIRKDFPVHCLPEGERISIKTPTKFFMLSECGRHWMDDSPLERHMHEELLKNVNGNILVTGLGLGLFFHYIKNYERIDVVEISQDLIDMVWPHYANRKNCNIVCSDIYKFKPEIKYDYIYVDHIDGPYYNKNLKEKHIQEKEKFIKMFNKYSKNNIIFWGI